MKKILLIGLVALSGSMNAQTLMTENFNALTIGNVTTNTNGSAPAGQGGLFLYSTDGTSSTSTNAAVTNAQIVSTGNASSNGMQITGPNGTGGQRFLWKEGLDALWTSRTSGNNIIEVEVDINPGAGTTASRNTFGVYIFNSDLTKVLGGFLVRASTRDLILVAYSTPTGQAAGNYNYNIPSPGLQLPANTFSRVGVSFNKTSGQIILKAPGLPTAGLPLTGSSAGIDPAEIDFVGFSGNATATPNTEASSMVLDNFVSRASATDTLLGNSNFAATTTDFTVYPNPANDVVTISNSNNAIISNVEMTDMNGRVVKNSTINATEGQINISDLSTGVYMLNVTSDQGTSTKKIVKN